MAGSRARARSAPQRGPGPGQRSGGCPPAAMGRSLGTPARPLWVLPSSAVEKNTGLTRRLMNVVYDLRKHSLRNRELGMALCSGCRRQPLPKVKVLVHHSLAHCCAMCRDLLVGSFPQQRGQAALQECQESEPQGPTCQRRWPAPARWAAQWGRPRQSCSCPSRSRARTARALAHRSPRP